MKRQNILLPLTLAPLAAGAAEPQQQPNIIVILSDDLGFSDLGCYGGEMDTPVLNRLAEEGVRLTQLYNTGRSCPSRACLLTGLYPHRVGVGEMTGKEKETWPVGYRRFRADNNLTIAEVLRENGYYTAMSGKWHLGDHLSPVDRGFEDYYGFYTGSSPFWTEARFRRLPETATPEHTYAKGEFYATTAITDYAIDFAAKAREQQKPLFLYLSYNAPHFPLQAPKERIDKYYETYLQGWDAVRAERVRRILELGLVPANMETAPRGEVPASQFIDETHAIPAWESLSADQQKDLARRMAIYAAMVDIMDENIGRLLDTLRASGQLDNTLIFFLSDNGACAEWHEFGFDGKSGAAYRLHTGDELEQMGQPGTYHHYGTGWAGVCCTPFRLYKHFAHEGGISAPCIMWWGDRVKHAGRIDSQLCHLTDIMTTCIAASGSRYPAEAYPDRQLVRPEGISLLPVLQEKRIPQRPIFAEHEGNRMVRIGDWKLVASYYTGQQWELYDIAKDRAELHDRIAKHPKRAARMERLYFQWADGNDVLPYPQLMNEYGPRKMKVYNEK